jgi:hypothetical protein
MMPAKRPDPPGDNATGRDLPRRTRGDGARHDQLTNAAAFAGSGAGVLLRRGGRSHFNEVTLDSSSAPSDCAAGLRPAKAIASIPMAKSEPMTAFALSQLSNSCGFLR